MFERLRKFLSSSDDLTLPRVFDSSGFKNSAPVTVDSHTQLTHLPPDDPTLLWADTERHETQVLSVEQALPNSYLSGDIARGAHGAQSRIIAGFNALVGTVIVDGRLCEVLLTPESLNKTRHEQRTIAASLGYRLATRQENLAFVYDLLTKEKQDALHPVERDALAIYLKQYVRDAGGVIDIAGGCVNPDNHLWDDDDYCSRGALFVRDVTQSE